MFWTKRQQNSGEEYVTVSKTETERRSKVQGMVHMTNWSVRDWAKPQAINQNVSSCTCQFLETGIPGSEIMVDSLIKTFTRTRYDSVRAAVTGVVTVGLRHSLPVYWTDTGSRTGQLLYRPGLTLLLSLRPWRGLTAGQKHSPGLFHLTSADEHNLIGFRKHFEGVLPDIS